MKEEIEGEGKISIARATPSHPTVMKIFVIMNLDFFFLYWV